MPVYFIDSPTVTWTYNSTTGEASASVALVGGGVVASTAVSANGTVVPAAAETVELVTTSTSTITRNLPAAASSTDVIVTLKKVDSGSGTVVIDANSSETIDGSLTYTLVSQYQFVRLLCDGSGWQIIGGN